MPAPDTVKAPYYVWVALALTCTAGFVDVIGYIALSQVFAANMTGNTVAVGRGLVQGDWWLVLRRGFAIPMFVLGLIVSRLVLHLVADRHASRAAGCLFGVEALLLTALAVLGSLEMPDGRLSSAAGGIYYLLVALPCLAMGLQNAALTHFGPLTIRTTHVTGTLAQFAEALVQYLIWFTGQARSVGRLLHAVRVSRHQPSLRTVGFLTGLWLSYGVGAALGAFLERHWHLLALVVPLAILLALVLLLLRAPALVGSDRQGRAKAL